jgi:hypothetical protein
VSEPLDYCRVKKIDEKGFGFLKSLYYHGDIFFHFSQITKQEFLDKLNALKRGDFFLYFTSFQRKDGKRKVDNLWYSLADVPPEFLPAFANRIVLEFNGGITNLFDLLSAFRELRNLGAISAEQMTTILSSKKILSLPPTILPFLSPDEISEFKTILHFDELSGKEKKPFWYDDFLKN